MPSFVQKCKSAYGLCKSAKVDAAVLGGGLYRVGSGPRHDIGVSGRANHPWLAAAEQGCSALPQDSKLKGRPETGKDAAAIKNPS